MTNSWGSRSQCKMSKCNSLQKMLRSGKEDASNLFHLFQIRDKIMLEKKSIVERQFTGCFSNELQIADNKFNFLKVYSTVFYAFDFSLIGIWTVNSSGIFLVKIQEYNFYSNMLVSPYSVINWIQGLSLRLFFIVDELNSEPPAAVIWIPENTVCGILKHKCYIQWNFQDSSFSAFRIPVLQGTMW